MALSLRAWCGTSVDYAGPNIGLWSALGGIFLGFAEPQQGREDYEAFLLRLKQQASKLMPHEFGLPSKFLKVEFSRKTNKSNKSNQTASVFWDEAQAKAKFVKTFGVKEYTSLIRFDIPDGCTKVGASANFFRHHDDVSLVGTTYQPCPDLTCVFGFPALDRLSFQLLSVDLDLVPKTVHELYVWKSLVRITRLPCNLTEFKAVLCEISCTDLIDRLCACKHLVSIEVWDCKAQERLPTQLGSLRRLGHLLLRECNLVGTIPSELGMTDLSKLSLSSNKLTGSIPTQLANLHRLVGLELKRNNLSGNIPTQFGTLKALKRLELQTNQLTGQIPTELGQATRLEILKLHDNKFYGKVPSELELLAYLTEMTLADNKLDDIPSKFLRLDWSL